MSACLVTNIEAVVIQTRLFGTLTLNVEQLVLFPEGLPGFPEARAFALLPSATPGLSWLQSRDLPDLALLLVDPARVIGVELGLPEPVRRRARFVGAVVTLPRAAGEPATVNLQAPVVVDRAGTGRQVILPESRWGVAHPFDLAAAADSSPA